MDRRGQGSIRVGTSGWQYPHWRDGVFYPPHWLQKEEFEYYASRLDTVEVNNTFYHLPRPETFDSWRRRAGPGFLFVLKYSRYGTHVKRLKDPDQHAGLFLERAVRLGDKLGPILVQLPPQFGLDLGRLDDFLSAVPARYRWAVEFRNEEWLCQSVFDLLRAHNAALCIHDNIDPHPRIVTADFVYLRYHGGALKYRGDYPDAKLRSDAREIQSWADSGLDVLAFFNNDAGGCAPRNAMTLRRYLHQEAPVCGASANQRGLFPWNDE